MQYLEAERMGNVLETFTDVCCCEVLRSAVYRDWSDSSWLECVQGKCSEWVVTVWIVNCLWGCGVWKLVCWLQRYVAVTVLQLAAMLWTHWSWTVVKIWKHENWWSCSFGFVCCVVGVCCVQRYVLPLSSGWMKVVCVWNVRCTAVIGVVVNLTTLSSRPHCSP